MKKLSRFPAFDLALGVAVALAFAVITRRVDASEASDRALDAVGYGCVIVAGLALSLRRRAPAAGLVVATAAVAAYAARGYPGGPVFVAPLVTAFFLASARPRGRTVPVVVAATVAVLLAGVADGEGEARWIPLVYVGWMGAAVLLGEAARAKSAHVAAVEDRARFFEQTREQEALRRAAEERLRVAREVHDVVAHTLAGIALQAGVGARLAEGDPAREALVTIRRLSKQGLAELRTALGILRGGDGALPHEPTRGLSDLEGLFADMAAAGLEARAVVRGDQRPLSPTVEAAAYRVVQESLTNVARHAGAPQATVCLTYGEGRLEVEVIDDGCGAGVAAADGYGIAGMRERTLAAGGRFDAGPRQHRGFRVWAEFPTGEGVDQ
ncbi:MAG TPA: sensor histidine kinase [Acidimicrobiales bacterium]|nr:sensor histidine kinase [Acidimicrobiales bacterium]